MKRLLLVSVSTAVACGQAAGAWNLTEGNFQLDLRPSLEAVLWSADEPSPALLELPGNTFFAPRLSLALDATLGDHWFFSATTRWDRGFDAGAEPDGEVRLDEILLRWRACDDQRFNFQIGKFPTAFGAWPTQSDFFDDAFLIAPLPYSQIIGLNTHDPSAVSPAAIKGRADGSASAFSTLPKELWTSLIWGPDYATGASIFGSTEHLDYSVEVKNSALSAHPDSWSEIDFNHPTITGRFGYRPDAAWAFGMSASRGPWLEDDAVGIDRDDLIQSTLGFDVRWAHHDLIVSGEVMASNIETPNAGDLRIAAGFIQARWKLSPGFWLAARFGEIIADDVSGVEWQPDVWRAEIGAGWRVSPNLLVKAGYSSTQANGDSDAGNHLLGTGLGWQF